MPLIEAALAFAITMLALSLICSAFVELIHRIFSMREAGLKYMLGQMFDQVLAKYVEKFKDDPKFSALASQSIDQIRKSFVERMSSNRAPMGVTPNATPTRDAAAKSSLDVRLWNGRDLAKMTPTEFMERLGSTDLGAVIKKANESIGTGAAVAADAVLKDVAQKFEAFGTEARDYFEGRARLLSVIVAIGLAFFAHVDAVDLFRTYLRDPNARAKVIEQSQAVTAQYKAAQEAADALKKLTPDTSTQPEDVKKQIEKLRKDFQAAIGNVDQTVTQYANLGVPLGWNEDRIKAAQMSVWVWTCTEPEYKFWAVWRTCKDDKKDSEGKVVQTYTKIWFQVPTVLSVWFYLFLGGLLVGLGAPFWYDAVTGLTNIRNAARGSGGGGASPAQKAATAGPPDAAAHAQPVTPVGAFRVSDTARAVG